MGQLWLCTNESREQHSSQDVHVRCEPGKTLLAVSSQSDANNYGEVFPRNIIDSELSFSYCVVSTSSFVVLHLLVVCKKE